MLGKLDSPLIIVRGSRWRAAAMLLFALPFLLIAISFTFVGIAKLGQHPAVSGLIEGIGATSIGLGLGIPFAVLTYRIVYMIICPSELKLSAAGLSIRLARQPSTWTWSQVSNPHFKVGRWPIITFGSEDFRGQSGNIGPTWEIDLGQILALIIAAKSKWDSPDILDRMRPVARTSMAFNCICIALMIVGAAMFQHGYWLQGGGESKYAVRYGAIATSDAGSFGKSWGYEAMSSAVRKAKSACRYQATQNDCEIDVGVINQCAAIARGSAVKRRFVARSKELSEARASAVLTCQISGGGICSVQVDVCA